MNHPYYHQWNKKTVSLIKNGVSAQNVLKCRQLTAHTTSALRKTIPSVNCCSFSLHLCQAHLSVTWLWCVKHVGLFFTCNCRVQRSCYQSVTQQSKVWTTYIHTYTCLTALCPGLPEWAGTRKEKPIWILLKRDSEWQWHQLGHMQVCTSLQTDNHASTPPLSFLQARCPSCNSVKLQLK